MIDGDVQALTEDLELLDSSGTVDVGGDEEWASALFDQILSAKCPLFLRLCLLHLQLRA